MIVFRMLKRHCVVRADQVVAHRCPYTDGPGEINVPIAIGGMVARVGQASGRLGCGIAA